jgi:hypothetical protein
MAFSSIKYAELAPFNRATHYLSQDIIIRQVFISEVLANHEHHQPNSCEVCFRPHKRGKKRGTLRWYSA